MEYHGQADGGEGGAAAGGDLDAIIISGDVPQEVLGKEARERMRLSVDGVPATLSFLRQYFLAARNAPKALANLKAEPLPFVSLNGPFLCQYAAREGFRTMPVPLLGLFRQRLLAGLDRRPRAVVISTTFLPFAKQIDAIAAFVKQHAPEVTVVAGGVHVYKSYKHKLLLDAGEIGEDIRQAVCEHNYLMDLHRPSPVDVLVVSNRGEAVLAALLGALRDGRDWRNLDNIAYWRDGRWRINPIVEQPYREVKVDWSRVETGATRAYFPVQAGIGCGFRCTFCDFCGLFPRVTVRSPGSLVEEIRSIPVMDGVRRVYFTDDNLFTRRRRAAELCRALIDSKMAMKWRGMVRVGMVDEEIAELMARSGCMEILLGIESGDPGILRRMKKRVTPRQILDGIAWLNRRGINTKSTFIIGFPGETEQTVGRTVDLLNAYPTDGPAVHRYLFFTFAVLPLSEVAGRELRQAYGLEGYGYHWRHATMDSAQASELLAAAQEQLKPQLSPSYVLEVPEMPGLTVEQIKRIYLLRNRLARLDRAGLKEPSGRELWRRLEESFAGALRRSARAP